MTARFRQLFTALMTTGRDQAAVTNTGLPYIIRYGLVGAFFGFLFPLLALVILLLTSGLAGGRTGPGELLRSEPLFWIIATAPLFLGLFAAVAGWREDQRQQSYVYLAQERQEARQLEEKAKKLERRTAQLNAAVEISRRLSNILNWDELMAEVVRQVKDNFDYYHAQIYLIDGDRTALIATTGIGQFGPELGARGYAISVDDPTSLVAKAVRTGEITADDNARGTGESLPHAKPDEKFSKMAVPIILDRQVVGVLDVHQSNAAGGLTEADANLLRSLATQLAVAMRNARLFREVETNLVEVRELQQRYIRRSWDRSQVARRGAAQVKFSIGESTTLSEETIAEARQLALIHRQATLVALGQSPGGGGAPGGEEETTDTTNLGFNSLITPIMLRNVPIGNLQLHEVDPARRWTEGELAFISAVMDQVAQTAENLRLLDEATERASREQLISQISDRLRRASDIETLMKIGVEELSRVLRPARTYVQFGSEEELGLAENPIEEDPDPTEAEPVIRLSSPSPTVSGEPDTIDSQFGRGDSDNE